MEHISGIPFQGRLLALPASFTVKACQGQKLLLGILINYGGENVYNIGLGNVCPWFTFVGKVRSLNDASLMIVLIFKEGNPC